jgi:hypothetical protein
VADCVQVQKPDYRKSHDPQSYNCRADGKYNLSYTFVRGMRGIAAPHAEELSEQTDDKNYAANNKGEPSHG